MFDKIRKGDDMSYILAADIGGTKLATALFHNNKLIGRTEVASDVSSKEALFQCLTNSFRNLCKEATISLQQVEKVSVGVPGIVDAEQGIAIFQNNIPWANFPLRAKLATYFPQAAIFVDNDVYMATWGEYKVRDFTNETLIYMTLSTGISCCTIVNGQFARGQGAAGEIGFNLVGSEGLTLEESVAGPAIEKRGRELLQAPTLTLKEMMIRYYEDDAQVEELMAPMLQHMSSQLEQMIFLLDPHCIVLGGGFFNHHLLLVERLRQMMQARFSGTIFAGKERIIEGSMNKGDAGIYGAALK